MNVQSNTSLITITSCNRLKEIKKYIFSYIEFCNKNQHFQFLISLDGQNKEYEEFCSKYKIPLLYSEKREGVGISKNRVIKEFPDFEHYFFIDDDIELYDSKLFDLHVKFGNTSSEFHHMSSTDVHFLEMRREFLGFTFLYSNKGGGYFNYFNRSGLEKVGGWHSDFAKYKRYGHTEHSYRFKNAGITKYPFTIIEDCINDLIVHNPGHVTESVGDENPITELFHEEQHLIDKKLAYFPVTTLSKYYFNGFDMNYNETVAQFLLRHNRKYPLIGGKERLKCFSAFYFFLSQQKNSGILKIWYFCLAFVCNPLNPEIKHLVKKKIIRK